jgi:biofilm PGA synthesis N-glycosyltransferase PgaC
MSPTQIPVGGNASRSTLQYVVISPARNERKFIEQTLGSMLAQTRPPLRWVIVSDGSTDGTDELIERYQRRSDWLELVRLPLHRDRSFAAKVQAFNAGFERVRSLPFDLIASLDADLAFAPGYFEFLVSRFEANPRLGVGGTPFVEHGRHYNYDYTNIEHVSGACQVFRRQCFEDIGGYRPIEGGGIDWVAVTTARLKGWETRTFTELTCEHLRPMGSAVRSRIGAYFHHGKKDYYLGGHPVWQLFRALHQASRPPYAVAGASLLGGYVWAWLTRMERPVPPELVRFHQAEQMRRLRAFVRRRPLNRATQ